MVVIKIIQFCNQQKLFSTPTGKYVTFSSYRFNSSTKFHKYLITDLMPIGVVNHFKFVDIKKINSDFVSIFTSIRKHSRVDVLANVVWTSQLLLDSL